MALDAFEEIEPVPLVRPEGIDAGRHEARVRLPVVLDVGRVQRLAGSGRDRPVERRQLVPVPRDDVHGDLHVAGVHVGQHLSGVPLEHLGIEVERRLGGVPAPGAETGAEVDHRIERDPPGAEGVDDAEHLRVVFEGAMRLHVAERPARGHGRGAGDDGEVPHGLGRLVRVEDEQVEEARNDRAHGMDALAGVEALVLPGLRDVTAARRPVGNEQAAIVAPHVDLHPGRGDEEAPSSGAEQHGRGIARPVHVGLPPGLHQVQLAAPVELDRVAPPWASGCRQGPALAHPEDRLPVEAERQVAVRLEHERLHGLAGRVRDDHRERVRAQIHAQGPDLGRDGSGDLPEAQRGSGVRPFGHRGREGKVPGKPDGLERDADAVLAGGANVQLRGLAGGRDRLRGYGDDGGEMQPQDQDRMNKVLE